MGLQRDSGSRSVAHGMIFKELNVHTIGNVILSLSEVSEACSYQALSKESAAKTRASPIPVLKHSFMFHVMKDVISV